MFVVARVFGGWNRFKTRRDHTVVVPGPIRGAYDGYINSAVIVRQLTI